MGNPFMKINVKDREMHLRSQNCEVKTKLNPKNIKANLMLSKNN